MSENTSQQYWSVWYPKAAATGILLLRSAIDAHQSVLVHAAPEYITVEVASADGQRIAFAQDLPATQQTPMCRLSIDGNHISREDIWPTDADLGTIVLLPGGEAGELKAWWHSGDQREWRWQVEFYNSIR